MKNITWNEEKVQELINACERKYTEIVSENMLRREKVCLKGAEGTGVVLCRGTSPSTFSFLIIKPTRSSNF
jgi:hypothetical protein